MVIVVPLFPQPGAEPALRVEKADPGVINDYVAFLQQCHRMYTILQASVIKPEKLADASAGTAA